MSTQLNPDTTGEASGLGSSRRIGGPLVAGAWALFALAILAAGWFGWSWYSAAHSDPPRNAVLRDHVLQAGEQAVLNVSSLSYLHLAQGISLWKQSSTGAFRAGIVAEQAQLEQAVSAAKTVTTARILDGALTSLRPGAGSAAFIVAEQTTVLTPKGTPSVTLYRMEGELTRTAAGWKLSALHVVPTQSARAAR